MLLGTLLVIAPEAQIARQPYAGDEGRTGAAKVVTAGTLVFPSGVEGTRADPLDQVDEVAETIVVVEGLATAPMLFEASVIAARAKQP